MPRKLKHHDHNGLRGNRTESGGPKQSKYVPEAVKLERPRKPVLDESRHQKRLAGIAERKGIAGRPATAGECICQEACNRYPGRNRPARGPAGNDEKTNRNPGGRPELRDPFRGRERDREPGGDEKKRAGCGCPRRGARRHSREHRFL